MGNCWCGRPTKSCWGVESRGIEGFRWCLLGHPSHGDDDDGVVMVQCMVVYVGGEAKYGVEG